MVKKAKFGANTYVEKSRKKIGRHKKNMGKHEKKNFKKNRGQGR